MIVTLLVNLYLTCFLSYTCKFQQLGSRDSVGIRLPLSGAIGVAANGVPIYPSFDNADYVVWEVCEGDACSSHSGKGGDYHYHGTEFALYSLCWIITTIHSNFFLISSSGDPYGDLCMYNQSNYGGATDHPPFIGWAADGFLLYGRYTSGITCKLRAYLVTADHTLNTF